MIRAILWAVIAGTFLLGSNAVAQDLSPSKIPFKTTVTPIEEHGSKVGFGMLLFLVVSGGVFYFIRKKLPSLTPSVDRDIHLKVVKQVKLNPRSMLYVVEFNQRDLLIGQSGDQLVCLTDTNRQAASQDK